MPIAERSTDRWAKEVAMQDTNPPAETAGEQDHEDPWVFAGADADAPGDLGRTDDTPDTPRDHAAIADGAAAGDL